MRYLFNSYSMPTTSLGGLLKAAERYGYDGLELRLEARHGHQIERNLDAESRTRARNLIESSGKVVACLCTSSTLSNPLIVDQHVAETKEAIKLAGDIGSPLIRVFGGILPDEISRSTAQQVLIDSLAAVAELAAAHDVIVCVETHDAWSDPQQLATVMAAVDHPNVGVLWDVWHTGRGAGSTLQDAYESLSPWIRHVQVHDGALRPDRLEFRHIGEGDIDHLEILALLRRGHYDGAIGGEWINWKSAEDHLPQELATLHRLERLLATGT